MKLLVLLRGKLGFMVIVLSIVAIGKGSYIQAKAQLAQHLLDISWAQSLATGVPQKPWAWADITPVARMEIPGMDLSLIVLEGISGEAMAFGPGRIPQSSNTLDKGVFAIGGHRDTHLSFLESIDPKTPITVSTLDGATETYKVTQTFIADSSTEGLLFNATQRAFAMITCYPFNAVQTGGPLRFIAIAEPVNAEFKTEI